MVFDAALEEAIELITEVVLRTEELTKGISVHVNKMKENASLNKGLDNSEFIMMELAKKLGKDKAHAIVYNKAIQVQTEGSSFVDTLLEDKDVNQMFSKDEINGMLLPERYVGAGHIIAEEQAKRAFRISEKIKKDLPEQDA